MNDEREIAALERVNAELTAQGYQVILRPNSLLMPPFFGGMTPDAIALGKDKNLAIEVAVQNAATERRVRRLNELIQGTPGWELYLVWITAGTSPKPLRAPDRHAIRDQINEIDKLLVARQTRPSLLLCWAVLEGIARALMPEAVARPQSPARLIEQLAREGHVTPQEADILRDLIPLRNRLIHGDLKTEIRRKHVGDMLQILIGIVNREPALESMEQAPSK